MKSPRGAGAGASGLSERTTGILHHPAPLLHHPAARELKVVIVFTGSHGAIHMTAATRLIVALGLGGVSMDVIIEFSTALAEAGIPCHGDMIADGKLHRFKVDGDHNRKCWYVFYPDGVPSGAYGCWKRAISGTWSAKNSDRFTKSERSQWKRRIDDARRQREAEEARRRAETESRAAMIWRTAQPVELHPYLAKKRLKAHGIRQYKSCLVIPLRDAAGFIHSLQFIDGEGRKRFLSGGAITGNYHSIGEYKGVLCIGEGYTTCATVHQTTGHATAAALFSTNLKPVAISLRRKFPDAKIIVCADNDRFTPGNPGVTKAREAALAVQGLLAVPKFEDIGPYDYYREGGRG